MISTSEVTTSQGYTNPLLVLLLLLLLKTTKWWSNLWSEYQGWSEAEVEKWLAGSVYILHNTATPSGRPTV